MAVGLTLLTTGGTTTDATSFNTASVSPSANKLYLLCVEFSRGSSTNPVSPSSISGNGLTWVEVVSGGNIYKTTGTNRTACTLYRAMISSAPSAGAITINFGYTATGCRWNVIEVTGVDISGTNGSGACINPTSSLINVLTGATFTFSYTNASANTSSRPFVMVGGNSATGITQPSGWAEIDEAGHATPSEVLETAWLSSAWDGNPNAVTFTNSTGAGLVAGAIGVELVVANLPIPPVNINQAVNRASTF